jgi:hypothetical protein
MVDFEQGLPDRKRGKLECVVDLKHLHVVLGQSILMRLTATVRVVDIREIISQNGTT